MDRHVALFLRPQAGRGTTTRRATWTDLNILLLTQVVPYPPDAGPKVKTYHVLRYLAAAGHRVTLVSFVRAHERAHLDALRPFCTALHAVPLRRSRAAVRLAH